MTADFASALARVTVTFTAAVVLVLACRLFVRWFAGARVGFALWLVPVVAVFATLAPAADWSSGPVPQPSALTVIAAPAARLLAAAPAAVNQTMIAHGQINADTVRAGVVLGWLLGLVVSLSTLMWRQHRFVRSLGVLTRAFRGSQAIFVTETNGISPALVGVLRPRLIVPADFDLQYTAEEGDLIVEHERTHERRRDPLINLTSAIVQSVFWFNPAAWMAAAALRVDQELACDEATLAGRPETRPTYARAIVKTQFALATAPLGCAWPTPRRHPVNRRLAMLTRRIGLTRRALGAVALALVVAGTGTTVWAAQSAAFGSSDRPIATTSSPQAAFASAVPALARSLKSLGDAPLLDAAMEGDVLAFASQLAAGGDVNEIRLGDGTPLIVAARRGGLEQVRALLDRGANPNLAAPGDGNPLIMAALGGHLDIVRVLVERGADVNAYVPGDETPLINAAGKGHLPVVRYLVEHGAQVNQAYDVQSDRGTLERRSPLGQAMRGGYRDVVDYLVAAGAQP